jgi:hypothetical protein
LWLGFGLPWGSRVDDLVIGDGINRHSLLRKAIEKLAAAF